MGYFVINRAAGIVIITASVVFILLFVIIAIRLKNIKNTLRVSIQEYQELKEYGKNMEEKYQTAILSLNDLSGRYEELNKK